MFASEVIIVLGILVLARRMNDSEVEERPGLDLVGTALSAAGLGLIVFAVLRSGVWGWVQPKAGGPVWLGCRRMDVPRGWGRRLRLLRLAEHRLDTGQEPLLDPRIFRHKLLRPGLLLFAFQYMLQAGLFFTIPLFLSLPSGCRRSRPERDSFRSPSRCCSARSASPGSSAGVTARVVRLGLLCLFAGIVILIAGLDVGAGAEITTVPLLPRASVGALASQLGSITVSAVDEDETDQVGGIQNTATNLGASLGTAIAGAVLIGALTSTFLHGIERTRPCRLR